MKYILILIMIGLISGCSTKQEQQVITIYEKQKILKANKISPVYLESIEFKTVEINKENYIILQPDEYEKLLLNIEKLHKYIKQQKDTIEYYESEIQ